MLCKLGRLEKFRVEPYIPQHNSIACLINGSFFATENFVHQKPKHQPAGDQCEHVCDGIHTATVSDLPQSSLTIEGNPKTRKPQALSGAACAALRGDMRRRTCANSQTNSAPLPDTRK
jgi:hypothetical protein